MWKEKQLLVESFNKFSEKNNDLSNDLRVDTSNNVNDVINLSELENPTFDNICESLNEYVKWQDKAKEKIADIITSSLNNIVPKKWPLWTLFFHWPTWVWKTEMVRGLSKFLFWLEDWFIKIWMENFAESHSKSRFAWSPPWYIWHDNEPIFSPETFYNSYDISKNLNSINPLVKWIWPINIILFDEVEKAHPQVLQSLLWILDDWKLELANTKKWKINFWNSIIIFTSNIW